MPFRLDLTTLLAAPAIDLNVQQEVEQFYFREALLLDNIQYNAWLDLLDEDIHYFMPIRRNVLKRSRTRGNEINEYGGGDEFAHFDEDITTMRGRIRKLLSDYSWSENPASRTRHLVSNVIICETEQQGTYHVCSNFLVYRNRLETQVDIFAGERHDLLRRSDNNLGFKIAKRTLLLDQSTILSNNISIFF